jgi:hypothetical protein
VTTQQPMATRVAAIGLTIGIVELTVITAFIHLTLGGLLFTVNGLGYVALAAAVAAISVVRGPLARFEWLPRIGLAGYTAATIGAYLVIGPYFSLGWVAKGIEAAILTLVAVDLLVRYGSPRAVVRTALDSLGMGGRRGSVRLG